MFYALGLLIAFGPVPDRMAPYLIEQTGCYKYATKVVKLILHRLICLVTSLIVRTEMFIWETPICYVSAAIL